MCKVGIKGRLQASQPESARKKYIELYWRANLDLIFTLERLQIMQNSKKLMEAALLLALIGCLQQVSHARCIPGCDDTLQQLNYYQHLNDSETHVFDNVSVNLREAEGSDDRLRDFSASRVCPWHYEMDYNASRLPQVMYTARCDTETWCDHTTGQSYRCLPLEVYSIPIMIGEKCDLFSNTEWTLSFVNRAVSCYPSRTRFDSEREICNYLVPPTLR